jgi:lipid-binding SYLF domain-containing protein
MPRPTVRSLSCLSLTLAVAIGTSGGAAAQSMFQGLKEKAVKAAEKVGETASAAGQAVGDATNKAVEHVNHTIESTNQDLRDEATPEQTRAKLDAMAVDTLDRLFKEKSGARALFDASYGYAVFDTRQASYVVSGGYGRGVAVNRETGAATYMRVGSAGIGIAYGFGGFDTQIVILFENAFAFNKFITEGLDASAEAGTMLGDEDERLALRFDEGRAVFLLTQKGWKISAKLSGSKYWRDEPLNVGQR